MSQSSSEKFDNLHSAGIPNPPSGRWTWVCKCPKCSEQRSAQNRNKKCLTVWPNGNEHCDINWFCNHCGWKGYVPKTSNNKIKPILFPVSEPEDGITKFFSKRGIPRSVVDRMNVGRYVDKSGKGWIAFRYYENGNLLNIKFRDSNKNFRLVSGGELIFWGIDDISESKEIIVCEGEIDKLSFDTAGYTNSISVPQGAPPENAQVVQLSYLDRCLDYFDENRVNKIILAFDNDGPGNRLKEEFIRRLGSDRCWTVNWPSNCKDANDVLLKQGKEGIHKLIQNAKAVPCPYLYDEDELDLRMENLYRNGFPDGLRTGLKGIDRLFKWHVPALTAVTGIPGSGKSTFIDMVLVSLAMNNGWKVCLYSPENYPVESHIKRLSEQYIGKPFEVGTVNRMSFDEMKKSSEFINNHFYFINPDANGANLLTSILNSTKTLVMRSGVNALVIDPWNMIEHDYSANRESETDYVRRMLKEIKMFARINQIMVIIIAHPTKIAQHIDGQFKVPSLYDIAGSANWYNMIDNGLIVHTEMKGNEKVTAVYVSKIKHTYMGYTGKAIFNFNRTNQRYVDYVEDSGFERSQSDNLVRNYINNSNNVSKLEELEFKDEPF